MHRLFHAFAFPSWEDESPNKTRVHFVYNPPHDCSRFLNNGCGSRRVGFLLDDTWNIVQVFLSASESCRHRRRQDFAKRKISALSHSSFQGEGSTVPMIPDGERSDPITLIIRRLYGSQGARIFESVSFMALYICTEKSSQFNSAIRDTMLHCTGIAMEDT